ncbi:MAG: calcium/sodium antiporter [Flavobacteriaceae bacterium]
MNFLAIIIGLMLLIKGGNWLMRAAVSLSLQMRIPKIVVGMTVVSFATSAPELIVSLQSALSGHPDLALGNVVGSNIANLAFVLAITVIISPIHVTKSFYSTDWPMMLLATLLFMGFLYGDQTLQQWEGLTLFVLLICFIIYLIRFQKQAVIDEAPEDDELLPTVTTLQYLLLGGVGLWLGSETLVKGAVALANSLDVSERVISISVVSIGTSIPELSASIIAVINKEKAISIGNLIGSNIFNLMAVMGLTAIVTPIQVGDSRMLTNDIWWMLTISLMILPLVFLPRKMRLGRLDGVILLSLYILFLWPLISKA